MSKAILEFPAPESCRKCKIANDFEKQWWCKFVKDSVTDYTTSRHPSCPLRIEEVKIPEVKIPFETFTKPYCRGDINLGSACGHCEKCEWVRKYRHGGTK